MHLLYTVLLVFEKAYFIKWSSKHKKTEMNLAVLIHSVYTSCLSLLHEVNCHHSILERYNFHCTPGYCYWILPGLYVIFVITSLSNRINKPARKIFTLNTIWEFVCFKEQVQLVQFVLS